MLTWAHMRTDFLFAQPSGLYGVARLFDFAGTFDRYNESSTPEEADARAMYSDWRMVGEDLLAAMWHQHERDPEQLQLDL